MSEEQKTQTESQAAPQAEAPFPMKVIMGQKVGMTQIYTEAGHRIPVSVIFAGSCVATQVKSTDTDGYNAVQLGCGEKDEKHSTKAYLAVFKKKNLAPARWLKEFRVGDPKKFQTGQKVKVDIFAEGDYVDISGTSKGKGFAGVKKRHNFGGLPSSHGASDKVNSRGSSGGGSGQPQRVLKGTRMAGRMGSDWVTAMKIEVVKVDKENQLLLVKGAVPGNPGGLVVVRETIKSRKHKIVHAAQKSEKKAAIKKSAPPAKAAPKK
jgi:large subunit ribosomal protein L3